MRIVQYSGFIMVTVLLTGCVQTAGNVGHMQTYTVQSTEAAWIRNGEPIEFEGEKWFPIDDIETLLDAEVIIMGEYRGLQFFVSKYDVRPYRRMYTKFGHNQFRIFEKRREL